MPSSITHQLIAEDALSRLPETVRNSVSRCRDEYYFGAQGPDVFFFYRIGNRSEYNLGKFMHRYRVYDIFSFFLDALKEDTSPRFSPEAERCVLAYALGFITHYCADVAFHPFVYRYLKEYNCEKRIHQLMENDWDVYFLREYREKSVENFHFAFSVKKIIDDNVIARLYGCLARALGREDVEKNQFDRGVKNFARYLKFFHKNCFSAQRTWANAEKFFHAKPFLGALFPRENVDPEFLENDKFFELSEGVGRSADELYQFALDESVRLMQSFLSALDSKSPLPREDYSKGLLTGIPLD